jgi:hypothetical protein
MTESVAKLINTFTQDVESRFRFLVDEHGFVNEQGLSDFSSPVSQLKSWNPENMPGTFWFIERFTNQQCRIEIGYGDRELIVEANWWPDNDERGFDLWEILNAAEKSDMKIGGSAWVNSSDFMARTIHDIAESLKEHLSLFINPSSAIIDRALEIRGAKLRFDQKKQRDRDLSCARNDAALAFRNKEYVKVIELLSPFAEILSEADKKKIKLCSNYAKSI